MFGLLALPYALPLLPDEWMPVFAQEVAGVLLLATVLVAVTGALRATEHPEERAFWKLILGAFGFWLAVLVLYSLAPELTGTPLGDLTGDALYLLFYLCIALASQTRPHRSPGWSADNRSHRIESSTAVIFLLAVFVYFVAVPSIANYAAYDTWLPSLYMYLVLDVALAFRFAYLAAARPPGRFRATYALLALTATFWLATDLLECLGYAGALALPEVSLLDLLWWVPYALVILAARLPFVATWGPPARPVPAPRLVAASVRSVAALVLIAFLFPALHFGLYGLGLLDEQSRAAREIVVLVSLLLLGALVLAQQAVLEGRNRSLQADLSWINRQLEHSQKLEAVGRLAGGVAHDFNNLLTAIIGNTQMVLRRMPDDDPLRSDVLRIDRSGQRAAALTRQLLAFGRRQVLQPKVLDLNEVIGGMVEMLDRLLGEDVTLTITTDAALGAVRADPGQIEQVIMNLALNARDAMPRGGRLQIETARVLVQTDPLHEQQVVSPGRYARLRIIDDGTGMEARTRELAFEPFFTTKERDKGTGLGLSTVYGIVRQSGGQILMESEPACGTTVCIYLPVVDGEPEPILEPATVELTEGEGKGQTILLVEDEDSVRELTRDVLELQGYRVFEACDGEQAMAVHASLEGPLALLLTDVVMPRMGGCELARRLLEQIPRLRVLFVSGYTDDAVTGEGSLLPGSSFLAKPFTPDELADKVREILRS